MAKHLPLPKRSRLLELHKYDFETGEITHIKPRSGVTVGRLAGNKAYGYFRIRVDSQLYLSHRLMFLVFYGVDPLEYEVDHIDGCKENNKPENLRLATHSQNQQNSDVQKNNSSGYRGVALHKASRKYIARIKVNKKQQYLGLFKTREEASLAYQKAASDLFGEFKHKSFKE